MSLPEILKQEPYSCAVDLWAVGVITYILLCGRMPFDEESRARLYKQILKAKYSFEGEVGPLIQLIWLSVLTLLKPGVYATCSSDYNYLSFQPWGEVSTAAKHFIQSLICKDAKVRLTAEEALLHPWIQVTAIQLLV